MHTLQTLITEISLFPFSPLSLFALVATHLALPHCPIHLWICNPLLELAIKSWHIRCNSNSNNSNNCKKSRRVESSHPGLHRMFVLPATISARGAAKSNKFKLENPSINIYACA